MKNIAFAIITVAVVVLVVGYAVSPYLNETVVDEPSPIATFLQTDISEETRAMEDAIMDKAVGTLMDKDDAMVKNNDNTMMGATVGIKLTGSFQGAGDGIHNASGETMIFYLENGDQVLRFEDFRVTNGPDLFVYLATGTSASDYIDLGRLKANNGNQNYELPYDIDLTKYRTVIIWCKAFSAYFGSAELGSA